jgi:hypothetical protein
MHQIVLDISWVRFKADGLAFCHNPTLLLIHKKIAILKHSTTSIVGREV